MKIAFNPSTVAALTTPPNNKDITFDLRGRNIFAQGVKFYGTDTNTWRDIKINNVSIGSNILDLRNGSNTTLTNIDGVVTINSTWRPVVDNLTSDSTTSSLSANQGRILKALIDSKSDSDHNHDDRYVRKSGDTMLGALKFANCTWNLVGDDAYMGDCNINGHLGIKAANATYPGITFFNKASTFLGNLTAYNDNIKYGTYSLQFLDNGNTSVNASTLPNPFSSYNSNAVADGQAICVWGQYSYLGNLADNTGYMSLWLRRVNAKVATLNMALDGEYYANGNQRLAHVSEIPTSLKNPYSLTTFGVVYDGSAAKTVTTSTFVSQILEGTNTVTDGTMFITSYAINSGFAYIDALNVPYKRKAIHLWEYIKAKTDSLYATKDHNITDITTSVNKLTFTRNGSNIIRDITVNVVHSQGKLTDIPNKDATTKASPGLLIYDSYEQTIGTNYYSSVLSINTGGTIQIAGNWGDDHARNLYWRSQSDRNVANYPWKSWRTILDSENTYVSNNKGYINGIEITQVNNSDTIDGWHKDEINRTFYITSQTSGLSSYWAKLWEINLNNQYNDVTVTFLAAASYYPSYFSIFSVYLRQDGSGTSKNISARLVELIGNIAVGDTELRLYVNNTTGNCQLWGNVKRRLGTMNLSVLKKAWRTDIDSPNMGTFFSTDFSSVQSLPGDDWYKVGVTQQDVVGVFNPAFHTHTVFKNNLMIKGTNGISDIASIHLGIGDSDTGFKWISDGVCQIYANYVAVGQWTPRGMDWFINPTVNGNKVWNAGNDGSGSGLDADTVDGEHASNFSYTHQSSFDFSKIKSGRIVTFDQSGTDYGWINGFASTNANYLTSVIFNEHRTSNWYVGYMEGNGSTGETSGLQGVHKLALAGGDHSNPIFLGYLDLYHGNEGTVSSSFYCLGYLVPFTYTRGGNYCRIIIPDTTRLSFYIEAAIASVHYSGGGMDTWVGEHRSAGAWWLHCYAHSWQEVRVKGFRTANGHNDSWWGGNPLYAYNDGTNRITVCIFGYVSYK